MDADTLKTVQALIDALGQLYARGDFSNGVTDPNGTIDEGTVRAGDFYRAAVNKGRALIAQMQRDAVQWKCQTCGTHEVSLVLTCHNSSCNDYASEVVVYQGWGKADLQPHPEAQALDSQLQQPDGHSTRASGVCASTTPLPLFAVGVAQRKWESLQADGYRMQRIEFARSIDGQETRGIIDPWGRVLWKYGQDDHAGSPAPSEPVAYIGAGDLEALKYGGHPIAGAKTADDDIGLYTHPAESSKAALSDDEIDQLRDVLHRARIQFPEGSILRHDLEAARTLLARAGITRKPLTREQITRLYEVPWLAGSEFPCGTEKAIAVARAIEAAHGITPQAGKESGDA